MICGLIISSEECKYLFSSLLFLFTVISTDLSSLPIPSLAVFSLLISLSKYSSSLRPFFIFNLFLWLCYSFHVSAQGIYSTRYVVFLFNYSLYHIDHNYFKPLLDRSNIWVISESGSIDSFVILNCVFSSLFVCLNFFFV